MAGLLVAAGLIGGLSLVLAQLSRQQMTIQKKAETGAEIGELTLRITRLLKNEQACFNTIGANTILVQNAPTAPVRNNIRNPNNGVVFASSPATAPITYRNNLIRIKSIRLTDVNINNTTGELNLAITFVKHNQAITTRKEVIKKFPLFVELDAANTVLRCISLQDAPVNTAKSRLCTEWGGTYDSASQTCNSPLAGQECPMASPGPGDPPTQQYLRGINEDMSLNCAHPASLPHPAGKNCYLATTYLTHTHPDWLPDKKWFYANHTLWIKARRPRLYPRTQANCATSSPACNNFYDPAHANRKSTCANGYTEYFYRTTNELSYTAEMIFQYCCQ